MTSYVMNHGSSVSCNGSGWNRDLAVVLGFDEARCRTLDGICQLVELFESIPSRGSQMKWSVSLMIFFLAATATAVAQDNQAALGGLWRGAFSDRYGDERCEGRITLNLRQDAATFGGTVAWTGQRCRKDGEDWVNSPVPGLRIVDGTIKGTDVRFSTAAEFPDGALLCTWDGTVDGDLLTGHYVCTVEWDDEGRVSGSFTTSWQNQRRHHSGAGHPALAPLGTPLFPHREDRNDAMNAARTLGTAFSHRRVRLSM